MTVGQGNVIRADSIMLFDGTSEMINSFQFTKQDAGSISDAAALDDMVELLEAFYNFLLAAINVLVAFRSVRAFNITQEIALGEALYGTISAGTQAGDALAPGVCGLIRFPTATPRVQLRKFIPPPSEAGQDSDGTAGAGVLSAYNNAAGYLLASQVVTNGTYRFGYFSPKTGGFVYPSSAIIGDEFAYQRRRKRGVGS